MNSATSILLILLAVVAVVVLVRMMGAGRNTVVPPPGPVSNQRVVEREVVEQPPTTTDRVVEREVIERDPTPSNARFRCLWTSRMGWLRRRGSMAFTKRATATACAAVPEPTIRKRAAPSTYRGNGRGTRPLTTNPN